MGKLLEKLTSGRFLLTIACGIAFVYATVKHILPPEAVAAILVLVFQAYFDRKDRNGKENTNEKVVNGSGGDVVNGNASNG